MEGVVQIHNEGMLQLCEDLLFGHDLLDFFLADDEGLAHDLHGEDGAGVLLSDLKNLREAAAADEFDDFEVLQSGHASALHVVYGNSRGDIIPE